MENKDEKRIEDKTVEFLGAMTLFFTDIDPIIRKSPMSAQDKRNTALQIIDGIKESAKEGQAINRTYRSIETMKDIQEHPDKYRHENKEKQKPE
jgi:hypothetical protein